MHVYYIYKCDVKLTSCYCMSLKHVQYITRYMHACMVTQLFFKNTFLKAIKLPVQKEK